VQVFFIRDGIQFVDLVHCLRPNPKTHIQEGWRILDFLSHHPESVHIVRPAARWPMPVIGRVDICMHHRPMAYATSCNLEGLRYFYVGNWIISNCSLCCCS
jgi:hypothetical protein